MRVSLLQVQCIKKFLELMKLPNPQTKISKRIWYHKTVMCLQFGDNSLWTQSRCCVLHCICLIICINIGVVCGNVLFSSTVRKYGIKKTEEHLFATSQNFVAVTSCSMETTIRICASLSYCSWLGRLYRLLNFHQCDSLRCNKTHRSHKLCHRFLRFQTITLQLTINTILFVI